MTKEPILIVAFSDSDSLEVTTMAPRCYNMKCQQEPSQLSRRAPVRLRHSKMLRGIIIICFITGCNTLQVSPLSRSTHRAKSLFCISRCCHNHKIHSPRKKYQRCYNITTKILSSSSSNNENQRNHGDEIDNTNFKFVVPVPTAAPFNHDIARTLFAPFFFSLYHYNNTKEQRLIHTSSSHRYYKRPPPFVDPSSAQTAERMLRRMMENRHRSSGRTVCPDNTTFRLVAGAYGRLRWGNKRLSYNAMDSDQLKNMILLEEEASSSSDNMSMTVSHPRGATTNGDDNIEISSYKKILITPADKLQSLLQLQLHLCHREEWSKEIMPSLDMYNRVLKRLAAQSRMRRYRGHHRSAEQALLWLQLMKSFIPKPNDEPGEEKRVICHPNAWSYAYVIDALSSHRDPVSSISEEHQKRLRNFAVVSVSMDIFAEQIGVPMNEIETLYSTPTPETYLVKAEDLLSELEKEYNKNRYLKMNSEKNQVERALSYAYACLSEGWGRNSVVKMSMKSAETISKEKNIVDNKNTSADETSFHSLLEHSIDRSHELLCRLEAMTNAAIPSSCYTSVILAASMRNSSRSATLAGEVLERMISRFDGNYWSSCLFHANDVAKAFSGCIAAHARNNDASKAENVLNQMIQLYYNDAFGPDFVPEVKAFGTCIALWGKFDSKLEEVRETLKIKRKKVSHRQRLHSTHRAEAILSELERVSDREATKGNENYAVDATPYNIVIHARVQTVDDNIDWYNSALKDENERVILHAQSMLHHMEYERRVKPDSYTYSILLNAWCEQSRPGNEKAADFAEELLRRRIDDIDTTKDTADHSLAARKSRDRTTFDEVWPNVKHYSSVLKAHARTKCPGGAKKALALLCEMERRYNDANIDDRATSNFNVAGFHKGKNAIAKPDIVCYSIVIDAFANSRLSEAGSVALRLLRAVEAKYNAGDESMKPNTRIYTAVILSLVHSPFTEEAHVEDDFNAKNITNNAQRSWSILEAMKKNNVSPNSFTYNYIINAAAESTEDQRSSFEVATRAFNEIRMKGKTENYSDVKGVSLDPCHPNSYTYSFMIKACNNLLPPGPLRTKIISQVFLECCRFGYLNDGILDRMWRGLPLETFDSLLENRRKSSVLAGEERKKIMSSKSPVQVNDLPSNWSRY